MFELLKEEFGFKTYFKTFEKALELSNVVFFNKDYIEFPEMLVFARENKGKMIQLMNAGIDVFSVDNNDFELMTKFIENFLATNTLYFKSKKLPDSSVLVNLNNIKDSLILYKVSKDTIICNNILFTTNVLEYQGSGMFSGRKNVFLIEEHILKKIKDLMEK